MPYSVKHIAEIIGASSRLANQNASIAHLLTDSRRLVFAETTLFFALTSNRRSGIAFIEELYRLGVRSFVVPEGVSEKEFPEANFLWVKSPLKALQQLAAYHRKQFNIPVIGITGSNGKTIVKEWLHQLLFEDYNIVRSPKSYNSQIGVPLSVWQMSEENTLAIFEAGISQKDEMGALEKVIQPTIGVLTNIGDAHEEGFDSKEEKLAEKWKLFENAAVVICNTDKHLIHSAKENSTTGKIFDWGYGEVIVRISKIEKSTHHTSIQATYLGKEISITIPFTDNASVENAITCWCVCLKLGINQEVIRERMLELQPVEMRLRLKKAINNCAVINDSYSNDISSLEIALDFLSQQTGNQTATVILSDLGGGIVSAQHYQKVVQALQQHEISRFIGIGPVISSHKEMFLKVQPNSFFFETVQDFIQQFPLSRFRDELILLKGARAFEFEKIDLLFEQQVHQTVLEVNLTAMVHNLNKYRECLKPETKLMAMVKAFSYGSGSAEIAGVLQFHKVDYLAVAYADEGVELRKAGIHMPIMVMNPEAVTFHSLVHYNLEPELYSFELLTAFNNYLIREGISKFPVHLKIDTGMHRLGFEAGEMEELSDFLTTHNRLVVKSVFSHLVGSEDPVHDGFTRMQAAIFVRVCDAIEQAIGYPFIRHIANSAAIFRHPDMQFNMVRLGIGLYGVDTVAESKINLQPVATLKSTIAQIRTVHKGETIGYSRKGIMHQTGKIATIRIGYADGFNRRLSNGVGKVWINGHLAPVIGNVCMDMTMIDVTGIENVYEGDTVEIFGANLPVQQVAVWCGTIPYEIMTSISHRVKRVYFEE